MTNKTLGRTLRRSGSALGVAALLAFTGACTPGEAPGGEQTPLAPGTATSAPNTPTETPSTSAPSAPSTPTPTTTAPTTSAPPVAPTTAAPKPTAKPKPVVTYRTVLEPGDNGPKVREAQARLRQIGWFDGDVSDNYGPRTTASVKGFQGKRGFPVTGILDQRTWDRLLSMTRKPTKDELNNVKAAPKPTKLTWDVDKRCLTGRVMCISKETRSLTWVIDGVPQYQFDVRFGSDELPTREGTFYVYKKMEYVISNLYHTPMPYSMFFSGGQAVHYSSNFARLGYSGASHGCVNVRDYNGVKRLFNDSRIGDKVVVHW
jgi:peptidoglycan hydrolase-like protein with peptidoglycan-binding domain